MLVEPIGEHGHVFFDAGPAVIGAGLDDEFERSADFLTLLLEELRLVERHECVCIAVDDESWRHAGGDENDRGYSLSKLPPRFPWHPFRPERRLEPARGLEIHPILIWPAPIQEIGRRVKTRHGLHGAALAVQDVLGVRFTRPALRAHCQREMPTRTAAANAEFIRIDAPSTGVMPHESDGTMNILLNLRDDKSRLRSVHDRKHGVAALQQWREEAGSDVVVIGEEAAAHHPENRGAILLRRLEHIERERRPEFAAVDDVFGAGEFRWLLRPNGRTGEQSEDEERGEQKSFHAKSCVFLFAER